jgi:hypothetical protein
MATYAKAERQVGLENDSSKQYLKATFHSLEPGDTVRRDKVKRALAEYSPAQVRVEPVDWAH